MFFVLMHRVRESGVLLFSLVFLLCFSVLLLGMSGVRVATSFASSAVFFDAPSHRIILHASGVPHEIVLRDRPTWFVSAARYTLAGRGVALPTRLALPGAVPMQTVSDAALRDFIQRELVPLLDEPTDALALSLDADGRVQVAGSAFSGRTIDQVTLLARLRTAAAATSDQEIIVPFLHDAARVQIDAGLQERGIRAPIGSARMDYPGSSENRSHNVRAGAEKISTSWIEPGAVWSFNAALFPLLRAEFREENVIQGGRLVQELGGGVCQVSSAVFRAALDAGLPIVEWHPHSLRLPHYHPPGLDAAVYPDIKDFRFKNDSDAPILLIAETRGEAILISLFGAPDGRRATVAGPFLPDGAPLPIDRDPGLSFLWTRDLGDRVEEYRARYFRAEG